MIKGKTYSERCLSQTLLWANGRPYHNYIDGECCPDFSCCYPELFAYDIEKRRRSYQRAIENAQFVRATETGE